MLEKSKFVSLGTLVTLKISVANLMKICHSAYYKLVYILVLNSE